jgi:ribose transport system substrate-binding protein
VWWPADNRAGIASLQALADSGVPVVQTNQLPLPEVEDIVAAYAGVNDVLNGQVAAELLMKSRDVLTESGHELASEGGNVIIISFPAGYSAGDDRIKGFEEATADAPFKVLATENAGFDAETGYNAASALIPANKGKGIDFVYATNDALAKGVIQALEENGYKPGKDVMVVGGTCHGDLSELEAAKQFGSGLQAARLEGVFSVNVVARYLASGGEVQEGDYNAPDEPDAQPEFEGAPFKRNFIPNPGVELGTDPAAAVEAIDATKLWGFGFRDLCTY